MTLAGLCFGQCLELLGQHLSLPPHVEAISAAAHEVKHLFRMLPEQPLCSRRSHSHRRCGCAIFNLPKAAAQQLLAQSREQSDLGRELGHSEPVGDHLGPAASRGLLHEASAAARAALTPVSRHAQPEHVGPDAATGCARDAGRRWRGRHWRRRCGVGSGLEAVPMARPASERFCVQVSLNDWPLRYFFM